MHLYPRLYITLTLVTAAICLLAQSADYVFKQFTTVDGLPSNECYEVFQDSRGFIWIGTDNGLARYDGYSFRRYGPQQGLGESVVFKIVEDTDNKVWVAGLSGDIYIYDPSADYFELYKYQNVIDSLRDPDRLVMIKEYFSVSSGTLTMSLYGVGLCTVDERGNASILASAPVNSSMLTLLDSGSNQLQLTYGAACDPTTISLTFFDSIPEPTLLYSDTIVAGLPAVRSAIHLKDTIVSYSYGNINVLVDNINHVYRSPSVVEMTTDGAGKVVMSLLESGGVRRFTSLIDYKYEEILSGVSATGFVIDRDGGWWISTTDQGIFYCKNPNIKSTGRLQETCEVILPMQNRLVVSTATDRLYILDQDYALIRKHQNIDLAGLDKIASDSSTFLVSSPRGTTTIDMITGDLIAVSPVLTKFWSTVKGVWYALSPIGSLNDFDSIKQMTWQPTQYHTEYYSAIYRPNAMEVLLDSVLLIGGLEGLCAIDPTLDSVQWINHFQGQRVEDVIPLDSIVLVATKGYGIAIWDMKEDDVVYYSEQDGLVDDYVEDIYFDRNHTLWVSTLSGISQVRFNKEWTLSSILNYTTSHGLPVPDVYQVAEYQGELIAATGAGLITLPSRRKVLPSPSPMITATSANGHPVDFTSPMDHTQNDIAIDVTTINFAHADHMRYRFRLDDREWTESASSSIQLLNVAPGHHRLEIQSQNQDAIWSASTSQTIVIHPPWWQSWWGRSIQILVFLAACYLIVRSRRKRRMKQAEIDREINDLEKAALSAQMNPHFIFNCLNSIQRYIMKHDREEAMEYLARFSTLIRKYLRASRESTVSLADEVAMLQIYLELEQVRFSRSFTFEIDIEDELLHSDIVIPTMLIQPYVENAILHGMKGKAQGEGLIKVSFTKTTDTLHIAIADNGPGIDGTARPDHISYGRSLTQRRIELIEQGGQSRYHLETESSSSGTIVTITIGRV